jgi:hypothetical protein
VADGLAQKKPRENTAHLRVVSQKRVLPDCFRAEVPADMVEPAELRELLYYLVDSVLERQPAAPEPGPLIQLTVAL